jgi:hypothetical protein
MNIAKNTYDWSIARLSEGYNVYFTNHLKSFKITPKNKDVLNLSKDALRINKDLICTDKMRLCKVTANFN